MPAAFFAAQCELGAKARFSTLLLAELLDPSQASTEEDLEVHHLSPKGWFKRNDFSSSREFNQVANLTESCWSTSCLWQASGLPGADRETERTEQASQVRERT